MTPLGGAAGVLAGIGVLQCLAGWAEVRRFAAMPASPGAERPPITVLKPLHGGEPLLEEALATICQQNYPAYQVVFGVRTQATPVWLPCDA